MTSENSKAWALLTRDEQTALSLKLGYGKSTWQAGEVMEKAHYKFLEIEARAKFFFKMFSEYFETFDELIPSYIKLDRRVRTYFQMVIGNRQTIKEAVEHINDKEFNQRVYREDIIANQLKKMVGSESAIDQNFSLMIFDFDRWNNYRVLPSFIQEPSAFKRRNKNNEKKNIRNLLTLNDFQAKILLDRYQYTGVKAKVLYMPLPSRDKNNQPYGIIRVVDSDANIRDLSRFGFYLFYKEDQAQEFYDHIRNYSFNRKEEKNNVHTGQAFWPKFRMMIKNSNNYNAIAKKIASRKFLESAFRDLDNRFTDPLKNKKE